MRCQTSFVKIVAILVSFFKTVLKQLYALNDYIYFHNIFVVASPLAIIHLKHYYVQLKQVFTPSTQDLARKVCSSFRNV